MTRTVWLVRHPPVALAWQRRCYGQSDPGLSREGERMAREIAARLDAFSPELVIHSGLKRTYAIARHLTQAGRLVVPVTDWRERDFGSWEGRSWKAIYRETGSAMEGMLTHPDSFRPGGGETTMELLDRVRKAWDNLPSFPRIAIIAHGGPIACARAVQDGVSVSALAYLIPAAGEHIILER